MWYHKFIMLLAILFLILGVTFYALIDSGVLESDEIQNVVHFFDKKETESSEDSSEDVVESTEINTEEETDEDALIEVTSE